MQIEDHTVEVEVYSHNDAVVFVYEHHHENTGEKSEHGYDIYKHYKKVRTAIPVDFGYDAELTDADKYNLVQNTVNALSPLYQHECDVEIGISFYMNSEYLVNDAI